MTDTVYIPTISSASPGRPNGVSLRQTLTNSASRMVATVAPHLESQIVALSEIVTNAEPIQILRGHVIEIGGGDVVLDLVATKTDELSGALGFTHRLVRPIAVELFQEQGEFVADAPELSVYAFGRTQLEALSALRERIRSEYQFYLDPRMELAPDAQALADRYQQLVQPVTRGHS